MPPIITMCFPHRLIGGEIPSVIGGLYINGLWLSTEPKMYLLLIKNDFEVKTNHVTLPTGISPARVRNKEENDIYAEYYGWLGLRMKRSYSISQKAV